MTPETISELKSLLEKGAPREFRIKAEPANYGGSYFIVKGYSQYHHEWMRIGDFVKRKDAEDYIVIRNAAPDLIKAVEQRDRYRAENKTLTEDNKRQKDLLRKYRLGQF